MRRIILSKNIQQKSNSTNSMESFGRYEFKGFMKLYKDYTKDQFSFLVNDTTLSSDRWKRKTRVTSCELRFQIYELRV